MKTLVVAEKKSAGLSIAQYLGDNFSDHKRYLESNSYIVSWGAGHLVSLAEPREYGWTSSKLNMLPYFPSEFIMRASHDDFAKQQLDTLKELFVRADVDKIVNACDPDREGEAIFRRIYGYVDCNKDVSRLWAASLTDKSLRAAFENIEPQQGYEGLANAGFARAADDWLFGMNLSRAYSNLNIVDKYPAIGRVMTPTLNLVVTRDEEIKNFTSEPYFSVLASCGGFVAKTDKFKSRSQAEAIQNALESSALTATFAESKSSKQKAKELYSTTTCQMDCSKYFGMTPAETDKALQSLYLAKLCTYPRTSSKYITEADLQNFKEVYANVCAMQTFAELDYEFDTFDKVVNEKKVEGHTALLPTELVCQDSFANLEDNEKRVLTLLCARTLISVARDVSLVTHKIELAAGDIELSCTVKEIKDAGYTTLLDQIISRFAMQNSKEDEQDSPSEVFEFVCPSIGDRLEVTSTEIKEGKTAAPKPYTDATLLSTMENAARLVEDKQLKSALKGSDVHPQGIGTPATRADIIEKLVEKGYLKRKGKTLVSTEQGQKLIAGVADKLKSPELTASMETELAEIEKGQLSVEAHLEHMKALISEVVCICRIQEEAQIEVVGACPVCGADVVVKGNTFACTNKKVVRDAATGVFSDVGNCAFFIFNKFFDYPITNDAARRLLAKQRVKRIATSKKGKKYTQELFLKEFRPGLWRIESEAVFKDKSNN